MTGAYALPDGWTEEIRGGMTTNLDPTNGGIIDTAIVSSKWFIVFNRDDLNAQEGFSTREEAFKSFYDTLK